MHLKKPKSPIAASQVAKIMVAFWLFILTQLCWASIVDRLIVEINHISYSQEHMETYLICKDSLQNKDQVRTINEQSWTSSLDEFVSDMIIDQEALRLGSFSPTRRMIEQGQTIIAGKRNSLSTVSQAFERISTDNQLISRTIAQVLRVEAYRRSKQRQASVVDDTRKGDAVSAATRFSGWLKDLRDRSIYRFYDGAGAYMKMGR